jgi:secernin
MCDTMAADPTVNATGGVLFAKNSDRERNEAQFLEFHPRRKFGAGAVLRTTYLAIPQASITHAVLLSRPFWIWGAEIGVNEHGVAIGNEAVHPRALPQRHPSLIGMDLLRLGVERAATAREAVEVITGLLEQHGQGGNCGHLRRRYYDNSFLIVDSRETYVLETVGRHWALQRGRGVRTISNAYTIGTDADALSSGIEDFVRGHGWWHGEGKLDFASAVTDPGNPGLTFARSRFARSSELLGRHTGALTSAHLMAALRDHGESAAVPDWHPQQIEGATICMHARDARNGGQSTASMVCDLRPERAIHWVTGTSAPCTGVFKPFFFDACLPDTGPMPGDVFDPRALWWRHEAFHRAALRDYPDAMRKIGEERDALEARFRERAEAVIGGTGPSAVAARREVTAQCWREAADAEDRWSRRLRGFSAVALQPGYRAAWTRFDKFAAMPAEA